MYLRLFAHILVGFLIGALYYDIGDDGSKVLSNLGFLFFNMLFLMYTSMTITILSCEYSNIGFITYWLRLFLDCLTVLVKEKISNIQLYFLMNTVENPLYHDLITMYWFPVPLEMPVLVKEHFNRWYSLRSYYLAITVSDIPFQVTHILYLYA